MGHAFASLRWTSSFHSPEPVANMFALTEGDSVSHLLSSFRPLIPATEPSVAEKSADTLTSTVSMHHPSSMPAQAVVPYQRNTRSKRDQVAMAESGNTEARLALIPLEDVEAVLRRRFMSADPEHSILSLLGNQQDGVPSHQAARMVLGPRRRDGPSGVDLCHGISLHRGQRTLERPFEC